MRYKDDVVFGVLISTVFYIKKYKYYVVETMGPRNELYVLHTVFNFILHDVFAIARAFQAQLEQASPLRHFT